MAKYTYYKDKDGLTHVDIVIPAGDWCFWYEWPDKPFPHAESILCPLKIIRAATDCCILKGNLEHEPHTGYVLKSLGCPSLEREG